MHSMKNKHYVSWLLLVMVCCLSCSGNQSDRIIVACPPGPLAYPLFYMASTHAFDGYGDSIELKIWKNPDQVRAMIAGKQADFIAIPTNTAAALYNKGVDLKLLNVSLWGVLFIVSQDSSKKCLADFKGETILMAFMGDIPHLLFRTIAKKQGLDPENDFTYVYVPTPLDAVQQLLMGRAKHAVLAEPEVSTAIIKSTLVSGHSKTPQLFRVVDLQEEWGKVFHTAGEIPLGGIAVMPRISRNRRVVEAFNRAYASAVEWSLAHPDEAGRIIEKYYDGVNAEPHIEALRRVKLRCVRAQDARMQLESFFSVLYSAEPSSIGGSLPSDGFYWDNSSE